jgi:hypothetical protein
MGMLCMTIKWYLLLVNLMLTNGCYFVLVRNFLKFSSSSSFFLPT